MTRIDIMTYEIHGSWWVKHISHPLLQRLAGKYFAWKVRRKWKHYQASLAQRQMLVDAGLLKQRPTP